MDIHYEIKFNGEWCECVTPCRVPGGQGNVGSLACHECPFFVSDVYIEVNYGGVVTCRGEEKQAGQ